MTDNPNDHTPKHTDQPGNGAKYESAEADASAPRGAIFITTFLTVVILVFWFGTYILSLVRS